MSLAIQKAVAAKLAAHGSTSSYTVVDNQVVDPPCIKIGSSIRRQENVGSIIAFDEEFDVTIITTEDDGLLHKTMAENVITALNDAVLDLTGDSYATGCKPFLLLQQSYDTFDSIENRWIRYVLLRFKLLTQQV